jgi:hypothetical protein
MLMSTFIQDAFTDLFPDKDPSLFSFSIEYSGKFSPYNGNVKRRGNMIEFNFSSKWKHISREIQIGLAQHLFVKLFKVKKRTTNMDIYSHFMKSIHIAAPKTHFDPILKVSFEKNNEQFFNGMMEMPNLEWGSDSFSKLGQYAYGSDTITMSTILKDAPDGLLDYVMYHEMLHKKLKFTISKSGRTFHHPPEFKRLEAQFPNAGRLEKELSQWAGKKRRSFLWSW